MSEKTPKTLREEEKKQFEGFDKFVLDQVDSVSIKSLSSSSSSQKDNVPEKISSNDKSQRAPSKRLLFRKSSIKDVSFNFGNNDSFAEDGIQGNHRKSLLDGPGQLQ